MGIAEQWRSVSIGVTLTRHVLGAAFIAGLVTCGYEEPDVGTEVQEVVGQIVPSAPVGTLPGGMSVGADGSAAHTVPLWTPSGRLGIEPSLALTYSSRGPNGLLGVGWSLAGASSAITRCGNKYARDAVNRPITFGTGDNFCLDGQRLVIYAEDAPPGEQGYRTEPDGMVRVVATLTGGVPSSWTVHRPDGRIFRYGNTTDSLLQARPVGATQSQTLGWLLSSVADRAGNTMTLIYARDDIQPSHVLQYRPGVISYTSSGGLSARRALSFEYEARTDRLSEWVHGVEIKTDMRLRRIAALSDGVRVRSYEVTYETSPSTQRSRLKEVKACDGATPAVCMPAATFQYSENGSFQVIGSLETVGDASVSFDVANVLQRGLHFADVNNDGRTDLLFWGSNGRWNLRLSNGTTFGPVLPQTNVASGPPDNPPFARLVDVDADGRTDLFVKPCEPEVACGGSVHLSSGNGFLGASPGWAPPPASTQAPRYPGFVDFDGDGYPDFSESPRMLYFGGPPWSGVTDLDNVPVGGLGPKHFEDGFFLDADGDGQQDLVVPMEDGGVRRMVAMSARGGAIEASQTNLHHDDRWIFADLNGDGKPDAIFYGCQSSLVYLNRGNSSFDAGVFQSYPRICDGLDVDQGLRVGDYNGDGNQDIFAVGKTTSGLDVMHVLVASADGRSLTWVEDTNVFVFSPLQPGFGAAASHLIDVNGDGLQDLFQIDSGSPRRFWLYVRESKLPDLLLTATNGWGADERVEYQPLTAPGVYTPPTSCTEPARCFFQPMWVVTREWESDGTALQEVRRHAYGGARTDRQWGFLGFETHKVTDTRNNAVTITRFDQNRLCAARHECVRLTA